MRNDDWIGSKDTNKFQLLDKDGVDRSDEILNEDRHRFTCKCRDCLGLSETDREIAKRMILEWWENEEIANHPQSDTMDKVVSRIERWLDR